MAVESEHVGVMSVEQKQELAQRLRDRPSTALLSVRDVAEMMGCSADTVWRMVRAGTVPAYQLGGPGHAVRIAVSDIGDILAGWSYREQER